MKEKLRSFNIDIDKVDLTYDYMGNIKEAYEKMVKIYEKENLELVLNKNIIKMKDKKTNMKCILGIKVSFDNLDKDISFIVRQKLEEVNYQKKYIELLERTNKAKELFLNELGDD